MFSSSIKKKFAGKSIVDYNIRSDEKIKYRNQKMKANFFRKKLKLLVIKRIETKFKFFLFGFFPLSKILFCMCLTIYFCWTRLPVPWFLYTLAFGHPIKVSSEGMGCSIVLLFSMLLLVFLSILVSGWKMSKILGMSMFVLYFGFIAMSLSFEYDWIPCYLD